MKSAGLGVLIVWLFFIVGWIMNLWKAVVAVLDAPHLGDISGVVVLQIIGIFTGPVGSLLGWFIW